MEGLTMPVTGVSGTTNGFRRSRGVNWTEEETEQLLEAWADRDVQVLLENGPHNRQAFERVSYNLAQRGMDKTPSQCREKIKKLKTIYRNLNNGHNKVSRKIRGRLVQKLHQVMGGVAINLPPVATTPVIPKEQEVGGSSVNQDEVDPSVVDDRQRIADEFVPNFTTLGSTTDFLATASSSSSDPSSSEGEHVELENQQDTATGNKRKKSKTRKKSRRTAIYVLIDKLIASQAAANERFAALEERRLHLDKELEERRLEAEAKRQEAQRNHELRLLSTMAEHMANVLKSLNPLTFTGARCEAVGTPITVAVSTTEPPKTHEVVAVGVTNGCSDYGHPDGGVYSTM